MKEILITNFLFIIEHYFLNLMLTLHYSMFISVLDMLYTQISESNLWFLFDGQ